MHFTRYTVGVLCAFALLLAGCGADKADQSSRRPVLVTSVELTASTKSSRYSGKVHAQHEVPLGFQVSGKVTKRLVDLGDHVDKGQLLAKLDDKDYRLSMEAAEAGNKAAQKQYELARKQYNRAKSLGKHKLTSKAVLDQRKTKVAVTKAQKDKASKQLAVQKRRLAYTRLDAGHTGTISRVDVEPDQVVSAGQPVIWLARDGEREVWINVPASRIESLSLGEAASVSFWALDNVQIKGKVRRIASVANSLTGSYRVKVILLGKNNAVKPGMAASVQFRHASKGKVIRLPLTSLYHQGESSAVWVVNPKGRLEVKPIKVLRYTDHNVLVETNGTLQAGDQVVVKGVNKLHAGQKVKPLKDLSLPQDNQGMQ